MSSSETSGWVCPDCGRTFAKVNQKHVCQVYTLDGHLAGKPAASLVLYERFVAAVEACGPFEHSITKGSIGFRGPRRVFAGVMPTAKGLRGYMDIPRAVDDARFSTVTPYTNNLFVHAFHLKSLDQFDDDFASWIKEAYAVGQGEHLPKS